MAEVQEGRATAWANAQILRKGLLETVVVDVGVSMPCAGHGVGDVIDLFLGDPGTPILESVP